MSDEAPVTDPVVALNAAAALFAKCFCERAGCTHEGAIAVAQQVTAVADEFIYWLRRPASLSITLVSVTSQDTGEVRPIHRGEDMAVELKTDEIATYDILAKDNRGFVTKSALDLTVEGDGITAEIVETPDPATANQLVVTAVSPSTGNTFTLDVPDDEVIAPVSDAVNVRAGDVAVLELGAPVISTQPAPEPEPEPEPTP